MNRYQYITTPFGNQSRGGLTIAGRTLIAADSARIIISDIQSGAAYGKMSGSKFASSVQLGAELLAVNAVMAGLCNKPTGEFASMSLDQVIEEVRRWGTAANGTAANAKLAETDSEGNDGSKDDAIEQNAVQHLAKRLLMITGQSEVTRLRRELPGDIIVTEIDRQSALFESNAFVSLCKAFEATRTRPNEVTRLSNTIRNDVSLIPGLKGPMQCCSVLGELVRYMSEASLTLGMVNQEPLTELDKRTILSRSLDGSIIATKLAEMERVSLMNDPSSEPKSFDEAVRYLEAVFRAEATQEELVRRKPILSPPVVASANPRISSPRNVSEKRYGKPRGRELRESAATGAMGKASLSRDKGNGKEFFTFIKENPGSCFKCKKSGHLQKDCPDKVPAGGGGGAYVCLPAPVYRASPSPPNLSNVIIDTGAAAASYVSTDLGFDERTKVTVDAVINGVGDGTAIAPFGGTVYARVPARVHRATGEIVEEKVVIRFDAVCAPKLVKGGTSLLSHAGFVHDGGINGIVRKSTRQAVATSEENFVLQVGALGALKDRTMRIEINLFSRDGLLWMPTLEFLKQRDIEALVRNPPEALKVFQELTRSQPSQ